MFSMKADNSKMTKNSHFLMISLSLNTVIIHCFQVDTNCKSPAEGLHWLTQNKNIKYLLLPRIPRTVKSRSTSMVWETLIRISCQTDWLWLVVLEVVNHSINGLLDLSIEACLAPDTEVTIFWAIIKEWIIGISRMKIYKCFI